MWDLLYYNRDMFDYHKIKKTDIPVCPFQTLERQFWDKCFTGEITWYRKKEDQDLLFDILRPVIDYLINKKLPGSKKQPKIWQKLPLEEGCKRSQILGEEDLINIDFIFNGQNLDVVKYVEGMRKDIEENGDTLNAYGRKQKDCLINIAILFMMNFLSEKIINVTDYANDFLFGGKASLDSQTTIYISPEGNYAIIWDGMHRFATIAYYSKLVKFWNGNCLEKLFKSIVRYPLLKGIKQINEHNYIKIFQE